MLLKQGKQGEEEIETKKGMVRESHSSSKKAKNSILIVVNDSIWKNQSFNSEYKHKI